MRNLAYLVAFAAALSGCAAGGGSGGGNYVDPLANLRNISMSTVASFAQTVKIFLGANTQEQAVEAAKQTVANALKDPNSAQFRNVRLTRYLDGNVVCGEVNAKNSYGGYVGFSPFVASTTSSRLYDSDNKYPNIQSATNAGLNAACIRSPVTSLGPTTPENSLSKGLAINEPGKFEWPARGTVIAAYDEAKNKGVDIDGSAGDPVYASADGRVVFSGSGLRGYGKLIILKHDDTYLTAYAHNQNLLVAENQSVSKGQRIAEMGSTEADQVKLHFEIRRNGKSVDPIPFLPLR
jgi:murein DD-endopeptidase MepM/ murein hydrolase activator NlpD